jgi:hypothetical protein
MPIRMSPPTEAAESQYDALRFSLLVANLRH